MTSERLHVKFLVYFYFKYKRSGSFQTPTPYLVTSFWGCEILFDLTDLALWKLLTPEEHSNLHFTINQLVEGSCPPGVTKIEVRWKKSGFSILKHEHQATFMG